MSRPKNKDGFRKEMAEAFIGLLEEKELTWRKEWAATDAPYNAVTKARYRGINTFWLRHVANERGYGDPRWATMVQIMDKDNKYHPNEKWHLKAGSKAAYVEYWFPYDLAEKKPVTWDVFKKLIASGDKEPEDFSLLARYTAVFNAHDIEGMPPLEAKQTINVNIDSLVTALSQNMNVPVIDDGGGRAYYSQREDKIHVPKAEAFESTYAFNSTVLHELAHATGHSSRLNREMGGAFGTEKYAYEELVAEMSACFMSADLATEVTESHIENHKAYVQSWINAIRSKPETLVRAIRDAQQAASYMDWQAGLISERDFHAVTESAFEVSTAEPRRREVVR